MEPKKKIQILSWILIFIVVLNLAVIGTLLYNHYQFEKQFRVHNPPPEKPEPGKLGPFSVLIIEKLKMNPEQIDKYKIIRYNFVVKSHSCFDSMKIYNDSLDILLQKNKTDSAKINYYAERIGEINKKLKLNFVNYYINVKNILTPEQKDKFYDLMHNYRYYKNHRQNKYKNRHR